MRIARPAVVALRDLDGVQGVPHVRVPVAVQGLPRLRCREGDAPWPRPGQLAVRIVDAAQVRRSVPPPYRLGGARRAPAIGVEQGVDDCPFVHDHEPAGALDRLRDQVFHARVVGGRGVEHLTVCRGTEVEALPFVTMPVGDRIGTCEYRLHLRHAHRGVSRQPAQRDLGVDGAAYVVLERDSHHGASRAAEPHDKVGVGRVRGAGTGGDSGSESGRVAGGRHDGVRGERAKEDTAGRFETVRRHRWTLSVSGARDDRGAGAARFDWRRPPGIGLRQWLSTRHKIPVCPRTA